MNFLAHLWLAEHSGTSLAGSILGDVVRGADLSAYPDDIAHGIRLHRRVDALTDRHPALHASRAAFAAGHRRYAGIVLDLIADHALSRDWPRHAQEPLTVFCARAGAAIAAAAPWFAQAGGRASDAAGFAALLDSYNEASGIDRAIARTARRLRDPAPLLAAGRDWRTHLPAVRAALPTLLGDLLAAMRSDAVSSARTMR
ncbi:MAG TPA: ACP phosphodiesterase [Solimonas sp.]|nr:ACP phosphodiesterase [Solimonas sp.]